MTTQLGKELKKLRIDLGITLMDMANNIGISSALLSSIENGRKRVPDNFLDLLLSAYPQLCGEQGKYEILINQARQEVRLHLPNGSFEDVELATALARSFETLTLEDKRKIQRLLEK